MTDQSPNFPAIIPDIPPVPPTTPKNIPIELILDYRSKGLTHQQVATLVGCSKDNVKARLRRISHDIDMLPHYKEHKADLIDIVANRVLSSITPAKLKEASAYQLTGMYGIFNNNSRLERGEATAILVSLSDTALDARIARLQGRVDEDVLEASFSEAK